MLGYLSLSPLVWVRQSRAMRHFVHSYSPGKNPAGKKGHFAVIVMPWLGTSVPWFSIAIGLMLGATGAKVSFVVDNQPFGRERMRFRAILCCVRYVLGALPKQFAVLEVGTTRRRAKSNGVNFALIDRLAKLNAIWALRGETSESGRHTYTELIRKQLERAVAAIQAFCAAGHEFDCIVVPGGVYGSSGVWAQFARIHNVRVASYDSGGRGILTVATNGIACQLQDIPRAFALLKAHAESKGERALVRQAALAELQRRRAGKDRFSSQLPGVSVLDRRFDGAVLLALNSSWDSAALGLHEVFESSSQWIVETICCLLEKTAVQIIVRQHPAERFAVGRSTDDYRELLRARYGDDPRVVFIAAVDPVNSYDLLDQVAVVVVHTSTIGVEAALKGKVVITASSSYYSGLGFVWRAMGIDQYNRQLLDAVAGQFSVSEEMKEDALTCYYLTQCCNWVTSPLSPEGFDDWIHVRFEEFARQEGVQIAISALRDNVPSSFLMHLANVRKMNEAAEKQWDSHTE